MANIPIWLPVVSALVGGGLVGLINFAMSWQDRKLEERKHFNELVFNAALENWKQACQFAREHSGGVAIAPLDVYIIHMLKLSEIFTKGELTKERIPEKLRANRELINEERKVL